MRDFPPTTTAFLPVPDAQAPDTSSPGAFLRWHLGQQRSVIVASALVGILWQLPLTVGPWLVGRTVDRGILPGDWDAIWLWSGLLLLVTLVGAVFGIAMHTLIVRSWLIALYGTTQMVARKAVQLGHVLPRRAPTGEVLSVASSDSDEFGALTEITARASAQLVAYLIVAAIVLSTSLPLGHPGPRRRARARRRRLPDAAPAAPPAGRRAHPQRRADLDGDRHRRGAADPARHRRRADVRPQLRGAVAAHPRGGRLGRDLAGRHRGHRRAHVGLLPGRPDVGRHPRGAHRRPDGRPADLVPRLRPLHGRPDPHLLRVRPEGHPGAGLGAQGDRALRAGAALARAHGAAAAVGRGRPRRRGQRRSSRARVG